MENESPQYLAEYAKSNRASCKGCVSLIAKDSLRIALMVQSRHFDGKQPNWYHFSCFFGRFRPQSIDEIGRFHNLRWEDQEKVRTQIERGPSASGKKGKGKLVSKSLPDFMIQYALSGKSTCKKCGEKIEKEEIRISHKEIDPEKAFLGPIDRWHHVGCFIKRKNELDWKDEYTADMLTNFKSLDASDRDTIKKLLDKKKRGKKSKHTKQSAAATANGHAENGLGDSELSKKLCEQSKLLWKTIDTLKKLDMKKPELVSILSCNGQAIPTGIDKIYDRVADGLLFGRLAPCSVCKNGQLVASSRGFYQCVGDLSEWTKCTNTTTDATRTAWTIPDQLKEDIPYLKKYKYKPRNRVFPPKAAVKPLKRKWIVLIGRFNKPQGEMKLRIEKLGGSVTTSMANAHFCISTKSEVEAGKSKIHNAELQDLFVLSEEFLDECEKLTAQVPLQPLLEKFSIASWGKEKIDYSDPKSMKRILEEQKSKTAPKKMKLIVKSGSAVDPESQMEDSTEVLTYQGLKYTATLSKVDMQNETNSYYKLQVLQANHGRKWYVFRSWGRVGTTIGGTKLDDFHSLNSAVAFFSDHYLEKTGNEFGTKNFIKEPRLFYPVEIDYGENEIKKIDWDEACSKSKLARSVQDLVRMIFDIETMKKTMMEYEIDLNKMPLGKLSKRQIQMAYSVLTKASELITKGELDSGKILDYSNQFYTLIPHDYGYNQPPLLNNVDIVKSKVEMLDSLNDIELAYNFLSVVEGGSGADVIDSSYNKLNCDILPIAKDSEEFAMIEKYAELTHASTHNMYTLSIEELFKIERKGEAARFRPFQSLPNRKLLWHGSRTSNYAGILSQGLRIAPPEAPVTGYMFGKGIYFADMVSKSANYCATSRTNTTGLCLLADVALGNMKELTDAQCIRKLPKGKHSVKGIGMTEPDPSTHTLSKEGYTIPMGTGTKAELGKYGEKSSLLYNEYIVYDVAQVRLQYLVKFKFNYKTLW